MSTALAKLDAIPLVFGNKKTKIGADGTGLVSLTDIWKFYGSDPKKQPALWQANAFAKDFIQSLASRLNLGIPSLWKTLKGKGKAGTWAHWQIATAYVKWLSPETHQFINEAFREWFEEEQNPGLKIDRALDRWRQLGKEEDWIKARFEGQVQRKALTNTLADHNCKRTDRENPFAEITNTGNLACIGQTSKEFKASRNLPPSAPTRDHLEKHQLAALAFYEAMTEKGVKDTAADGNSECTAVARKVGQAVKTAMRALTATR